MPEPDKTPPTSEPDQAVTVEDLLKDNSNPALFTAMVIQAVLFASGEAVTKQFVINKLSIPVIAFDIGLQKLRNILDRDDSAIMLHEYADNIMLITKPEYGDFIRQARGAKKTRLSQESLETLTIVAYRQPITKGEVEKIRGVNCDSTLNFLADNGFVRRITRISDPGSPFIYETTEKFLSMLGIGSLAELPPLEIEEQTDFEAESKKWQT